MAKTMYVGMIGGTPTHASVTLEAAQEQALTDQRQYLSPDEYETRWDEHSPGKTWRLMQRRRDRSYRFSWTQRAVHAVGSTPEVRTDD
ncbi:hypothetical protein [Streptomyces paludis]|uniref:Uncharacterized protein n=1 Tax=Streptomyces paludis TaxID=2282738 RepID=A0A345HWQ3_9ACTN|nr:hypothetical protein [Streptomyces paludis]AXG81127.1 hypothetical protein DVK44_29440 [Streptomyces paludis]